MPTTDAFAAELRARLRRAERAGLAYLDVNSGQLHRDLGGYPGTPHNMPQCCDAMYAEQKTGDTIMSAPPKGKGASLTIRYRLPR